MDETNLAHPHSITRRLTCDVGHRLMGHEGKCRNYHGHTYVFEITVEAAELDQVGRVIDFGVVKELVGGWVDEHLDHGMILHHEDPMAKWLMGEALMEAHQHPEGEWAARVQEVYRRAQVDRRILKPSKVYLIDVPPTAENIAQLVLAKAQELLAGRGLHVAHVRVHETENCWADAYASCPPRAEAMAKSWWATYANNEQHRFTASQPVNRAHMMPRALELEGRVGHALIALRPEPVE